MKTTRKMKVRLGIVATAAARHFGKWPRRIHGILVKMAKIPTGNGRTVALLRFTK